MKKEDLNRLSLVDGSLEEVKTSTLIDQQEKPTEKLEPLFEEIVVSVLTFEGLEEVIQKRLIGFKKGGKDA